MDNDKLRQKLEIKMFCSKHPNIELTFSLDSRLRASSAHVVNAEMLVNPCRECKMEADKIKDAAKLLMSAANISNNIKTTFSVIVATQYQHIRRIVPLDKAVRIKESLDNAISEAESLNKQL